MSLVVARRVGTNVVVVSDTFITSRWQERSRSLLQGIIKTRVLTDEVAVSFAGSVDAARRAFLELEAVPALTPERVRDSLLRAHVESLQRGDSDGAGASEFLIAVADPARLIQVKNGEATTTDAAWLGSDRAFRRFQGYVTGQIEPVAGRIDTAAFSLMSLPDGGQEGEPSDQLPSGYEIMFECMRLVIEDSSVPEVGGFVVPVGSRGGRMSYLDYASVVTHPLHFDLLPEPKVIPFGTAAEGGHAINLMSDRRSSVHGLALYVLQARAGAAFSPSDGLMRPTLIRDASPIEFEELLAAQQDFVGGTFYGDPAEYCDRAMTHLRAGELDQALADAESAVARTDKLFTGFSCRGIVLAALGRLDDAIADFDRALELNAVDFRSLANRGAARAQRGDLAGALADLDRSVDLNQRYEFAYRARARVRRAASQSLGASADEAEVSRLRASPLEPESGRAPL